MAGSVLVLAQKCNQWDGIHLDRCLYTDQKQLMRYGRNFLLHSGDIVINSTGGGTVGRTSLIRENFLENKCFIVWDTHITVVRPLAGMDNQYLLYFLISPKIQNHIEDKCAGSTNQIELNAKTIKSYQVPIPPYNEQIRIRKAIDKLLDALH